MEHCPIHQRVAGSIPVQGQPINCGEPFQAWEMWLSPHSEKPAGSEVGGQDPCPWISSPVGNQACIVPRLLRDLLLLKLPHPELRKQTFTEYFYLYRIWARPSRYGTKPFRPFLLLHCKYPPLMYSATPSPVSAKITTQNKPLHSKGGPSLMVRA